MRRLALAGAAVVAVSFASPPLHAAVAHAGVRSPDWVMLIVAAGPQGASHIQITYQLEGHITAATSLYGNAIAAHDPARQDHPNAGCGFVYQFDGAAPAPGTVGANPTRFIVHGSGPAANFDPGEQAAEMTFVPGAVITKWRLGATAGSGSLHVTRVVGDGAGGVSLTIGKQVQPAGVADAGFSKLHTTARTALAGSFMIGDSLENESAYQATSTSPSGEKASFLKPEPATAGCGHAAPNFAGRPGRWQWSWQGASQQPNERYVAGWAPVGRYWRIFDAPPPAANPVAFVTFPLTRPTLRIVK